MKFRCFNLMLWPYLLDDFADKHRSVSVDVDSRLRDPVKANRVYDDYLDLTLLQQDVLDALNIDSAHVVGVGIGA